MTIDGYARASTDWRSVDAPARPLSDVGCEKVFDEVASGAKSDCAQLTGAIERAHPSDAQDEVTRARLIALDDEQSLIVLTSEEEASFAKSLAQFARGEFASDERMRIIWTKHGL